jgi:hypothetical protein
MLPEKSQGGFRRAIFIAETAKEGSGSFLKKRTKKLLEIGSSVGG